MHGSSEKTVKKPAMIDPFGRVVSYLRVSVTDRCDFRCEYCMSEDMTFLPKSEVLTLEELYRVCTGFVRKGVRKIRLTGGEPLVRRDIMTLIKRLGAQVATGELEELTLTTNGSQLSRFADELVDAGIKRINVSVDSLNVDKFRKITRRGDLNKVLTGIKAASKAGLAIKINAVAMKGLNDSEFDDMIRWCGNHGHDMTLIETMPMGEVDHDRNDYYLPLVQVRADLDKRWTLEDLDFNSGGPARYVRVGETGRKLGFITPLSHNFCESCNRVRLTCTGILYMCLGQNDKADLRFPLRVTEDESLLDAAIDEAIGRKPKGHDFVIDRDNNGPAVERHMSVTGG